MGFICIAGCKMNNINVVYTPWANLKKTGEMDVGQIGFFRQKEVSRGGGNDPGLARDGPVS